jgi:glycosyltransferase involved in cell wall biosynthesis
MKPLVLTFTNLFPSSVMPTHGIFVQERMTRVAAAMPEVDWQVVAPVPQVAWLVRNGLYKRWHTVPDREVVDSVVVHHPRFRHWPGLSARRQADAVAAGAIDLVRTLAKGRKVVLDAHYVWPDGIAAAVIARQLSLPFVMTARGTDINVLAKDSVIRARIAEAVPRAVRCYAVSRALADRFAHAAGLPMDHVEVARNGVDLERFRPGNAASARRELGLPANGRLLLGIGRQVAAKGFHLAAAALSQLPNDVRLVLVGDGPDRSVIQDAGGDRVIFLGTQPPERVALACRACDLLVLPSEREGWPNVVTEALASGLRVVATRTGGIPEILGDPPPADGSLGALIAEPDADLLAAAIAAVLAVPAEPARVRQHAEQFGWESPVLQLCTIFRQALGLDAAALGVRR